MSSGVVWQFQSEEHATPPLDAELAGWDIYHRRSSHLNARRTHAGQTYHLKWYFHRLFRGNPAVREFDNARQVEALGIPTVVSIGWGTHDRGTFFIMLGSPGAPLYSLDEMPDASSLHAMSRELGGFVAKLHNGSLCHRDLYVDHVLIHENRVRLIDVERVMRFTRRRWIIKDLGGLLFSAWRDRVPTHACRAFLSAYLGASRREWDRRQLLRAIQRKANRYRKHNQDQGHVGSSVSAQKSEAPAAGAVRER